MDEEAEEMHYKRSWTTGSAGNGSSSSVSQSEFPPYDNVTFDARKQPMANAGVEEIPMPMIEATQPDNGGGEVGGANSPRTNGLNDEHVYSNEDQGYANPAFLDPVSRYYTILKG